MSRRASREPLKPSAGAKMPALSHARAQADFLEAGPAVCADDEAAVAVGDDGTTAPAAAEIPTDALASPTPSASATSVGIHGAQVRWRMSVSHPQLSLGVTERPCATAMTSVGRGHP